MHPEFINIGGRDICRIALDQALWPVRGVIKGDICPDPLGVICDDCASAGPGRGLPAPAK